MFINIGYDDHESLYELDDTFIPELMKIDDMDEMNDFIIDNGTLYETPDSLFLDTTDMEEGLASLHEELNEYTNE